MVDGALTSNMKRRLERQKATRSLLAPDGRDLVNWTQEIDDGERRFESREEESFGKITE